MSQKSEESAEQSYPPKEPEIVAPTTPVRQLGGITGKGFMPGHGKIGSSLPPGLASMIRRQTKDGAILVRRMYQLFMGEKVKKTIIAPGSGKIVEIEVRPSVPDMIEAGKWLADRGWGKALEIVHIEGETRRPVLIVLPGPRRDPLEDDPEPVDEPKRKLPAQPPHMPEIDFNLNMDDPEEPTP